ncbi:MAG TPA: adenosylcobinamide-GDP ribazoletransferase [Alphaproteobacteria bacterium]|nr:adenosylcobinamide-GDP ribazoletransferase [Alphaproteobacteria bacterium]
MTPVPHGPRLADDFLMGVRFFSRLPAGEEPHAVPSLERMAPAAPFVSVAIAFLPALAMMGLCWVTAPPTLAAALGVGLLVALTGAMPEDALADAADGLVGGATIERRLEIMRDSRHGTYGVVSIVLSLIVRITGLGAVAAVNPLAAGGILIASTVLARSGSLWLSVDLPSAREGGASASVGRLGRRGFFVGAAFALLLSFVLAAPFVGVLGLLVAVAGAAGIAAAWTSTCRRLVGGQTGDLIGALHALIEVVVVAILVTFA